MKRLTILLFILCHCAIAQKPATVLVEAESFENKGGWSIDQQFMDVMGSSFLMAHGMGRPVEDASTTVTFPETGTYKVYVRTRNWTAQWSDKDAGLRPIR